jgi:hypothetical protein
MNNNKLVSEERFWDALSVGVKLDQVKKTSTHFTHFTVFSAFG